MSRHRNVRHLVAEEDYYDDDYDDDYDDYGDDGYDDYDDQYQRPTAQAPKQQQQQQQQQQAKPKAQQQQRQQAQSNSNTVSFAANTTNKAIPKAKAKTPPRPRGGVTTPPPGFSATPPPSSRQQQPSSSAKKGGIATPPPGFSTAPPSPHKSPQPFGLPGSAPNSPVPTTTTSNVMTTATPKNSRPSTPTQQQTPSSQNSKRPPPPPVPPILLRDDDPNAKPTLTCVILGHVDAGKSTLTGQLLWANAHDKTFSSNSNSSNNNNNDLYAATPPRDKRKPKNLAWLLDEDEQERQHGITMEVATKTLYTPQYRLVLQDAPGHADYVPNFIAGTAAADAAVAVVDVTDTQQSALARGQLREHLYLAKGLGVSHVIVALNKMDVLEWDQGKYQAFVLSLSNFLFQSAGFAKAKVQFVPISGLQGVNVYQRLPKDGCPQLTSWYKGPTLWEAMQALELPNPSTSNSQQQQPTTTRRRKLLEKPLRLLLTDILQEQGKGVAVRAKLVAGWLGSHVDPRLTILPLGDTATVGKLVHVQENLSTTTGVAAADSNATDDDNENRSNYAVAGDLVDLVLSGVDVARLTVGNVLIRPQDTTLVPAKQCRCRIYVLENLTTPIIRGATAMFHIHSIQVPCYLSQLVKSLVKGQTKGNSGEEVWKDKPRALTKQSQAVVEITLQQAAGVVMEAFSDCRALGRFVLRRSGESIAVGRIEQVLQ